ncbi:FlxA-like family protein [Methylophaga pinxianii]|uniref:FlxA-like family protein n=1 Tax=Methylophaga pinxianii TaxID=2881052 RepID=UPI001CF34563|nr:FlxA-like family protein [Methylophaga pinxianii]MCB2427970.1 FlxA-like family protein [Methylophaga pinxianii]UPH44460.1 FlxA-like family protein [Methylophaga pinxianii]
MSHPISVDMRSSSVSTTSTANSKSTGQSLDARIAALKQKLVDLFDQLKQIGQERTPESVEKAEMIQMQIQVIQAQIMQLEAMKQQKIQEEQQAQQQAESDNPQTTSPLEASIGQNVNTFI